jgi:Uma2 family endonuclease
VPSATRPLKQLPHRPETAYFPLAPDWVCEVLSPSTVQIDRARKLGIYARENVAHAWLIDPLARTLEVLRLEGGRWVLLGTHVGDEVVRAEPFVKIDLELRLLWSDPADATAPAE